MVGLNQGMVSNAGGAVRRRQAVRLRPRGRPRGHRGVPRDQVRRDERCDRRPARPGPRLVRRGGRGRASPEPEGAALATATPDGRPSVRFVLLTGSTTAASRFFTNYGSRKGRELTPTRVAALALWWQPLQRQLRARGPGRAAHRGGVRRLLRLARPRLAGSAPGRRARATVIPGREVLDEQLAELEQQYRRRGPAPGVLGRLPAAPAGDRVLGGPRQPPARPRALPARGRRLAPRAAQPVVRRNSTAQMTATMTANTVRPQPSTPRIASTAPTMATRPAAPPTCTSR